MILPLVLSLVLFALGIILSLCKSSTDLYHILFGNVLAVADTDILITCVVGVIVLILWHCFIKSCNSLLLIPQWLRPTV